MLVLNVVLENAFQHAIGIQIAFPLKRMAVNYA